MDSDAQSKCLVCSIDKFDLDAAGIPFDTHTEDQHNRWAYLYVAAAVQIKPKDEHGSTESIVNGGLEAGRTKFLPLETCVHMELQKHFTPSVEEHMHARLQTLETQIEQVLERLPAMDAGAAL